MNDTGMGGNMPYITDADLALDYRKYSQTSFRPHHGLHLGIFLTDNGVIQSSATLQHEVYLEYIKDYLQITNNDLLWKKLYKSFDPEVKKLLIRMEEYYET